MDPHRFHNPINATKAALQAATILVTIERRKGTTKIAVKVDNLATCARQSCAELYVLAQAAQTYVARGGCNVIDIT